jgi:hypothetical protein
MSNKFEQLLELLINEENDKAEALFHEIVVEKSRDIYEGLAETKDNDSEEKVEETTEEKVEETAKDEAVDEGEEVEIEEDSEDKKDETVEEESIEEVGGDATDELVKDISAEEEGEGEMAADEMGDEMDAEQGEEGDTEERVADLEDALDELKAEFEKMMSGDKGEEEENEESLEAPVEQTVADEIQPMEAKHDDKKKEKMDEYKIQKSADNKDHADHKKSPVADKGGKDAKADAKNIAQGGAEDKGRPAPTAQKMAGDFENTGGKDKSTSMKKEVKADNADHSDKSAKSPVASK